MVRATRGRRSGPMTMSATTAITISSENPTSNTGNERIVQAQAGPDIARFFRAENAQNDQQHDQPVPNAPGTHGITLSIAFQHRAQSIRAADDMDVQMIHLLPAHTSGVDDDAKAVGRPLLARQARRHGKELAQHCLVARVAIRQRIDLLLGAYHEMHLGQRMDVMEAENFGVLVDFPAGDFSAADLAQDASLRVHPYFRSTFARRLSARAACSSIPEMPSRRRSSASTSAGRKPYCASMIRQ